MTAPRLPVRLSSRVPIAGGWRPSQPFYEQTASIQHWTVSTAFQAAGIEAQVNELGYRIGDASSLSLQVQAELAGLKGDPRLSAGERAEGLAVQALALSLSRQDAHFRQEIGAIHGLLIALSQQVAESQQRQQSFQLEAEQNTSRSELQTFTTLAANASRLQNTTDQATQKVELVESNLASLTTSEVPEGSRLYYTDVRTDGRLAAAGIGTAPLTVTVDSGSAVSLTTGTAADVGFIDLTEGTWAVTGNASFFPNAATDMSILRAWISDVSATQPSPPNIGAFQQLVLPFSTGSGQSLSAGAALFTVPTGTTRVYLGVRCTFAINTLSAGGHLSATRVI